MNEMITHNINLNLTYSGIIKSSYCVGLVRHNILVGRLQLDLVAFQVDLLAFSWSLFFSGSFHFFSGSLHFFQVVFIFFQLVFFLFQLVLVLQLDLGSVWGSISGNLNDKVLQF